MHCDMSAGDFLHIEKSKEQLVELVKEGVLTSDQAGRVCVSSFVIVSPVRKERNESKLSEDGRLNEHGYEDNADMKFYRPRNEFQVKCLFKLCKLNLI